jgi:integrase
MAARKILADPPSKHVAPPKMFAEARHQFLETHGSGLRPSSLYQITRTLSRYFTWTKPLTEITHDDVASVLDRIKAPSERAHAQKDIITFFNWCVPRYLQSSPCAGLKKKQQKDRDRILTPEELKKVWLKAVDIGYPYGTIIQLLILLGQRTGETAALRWDWIKGDLVTIPGEFTKNGHETTVPLGSMALAAIKTVPHICELLFPARGYDDKPFAAFGVRKIALDECGVRNFTHHDLRRTASSMWAEIGVPQHINDRLLNHVSGGRFSHVARIYNRYEYLPEKRAAINAWETHLARIISPSQQLAA